MENRRQFTRVLLKLQAVLTIAEQEYPVNIHDISLKGALISLLDQSKELKGQSGTLNFKLNSDESAIEMQVDVAHQDTDLLGLECTRIDIDSITYLRRIVELNLGDEKQLSLELSQLSKD